MTTPAIVFCADDFTGASDTLATLARAGLSARLFLRVSDAEMAAKTERLDAIGVASSLRSMERRQGHVEMEGISAGLATLGAPKAHYKICSTFDSSPQIGNICESANVFAEAIGASWIAILGGQPSLGRYCLFGNLFAAAGDGEIYRIDRHPTMRQHPITPMAEADLREHLRLQGWERIGLIDFRAYQDGVTELVNRLEERLKAAETHTLFDVSGDGDLAVIGQALRTIGASRRILCVGASSVAEALCAGLPNARSARAESDQLLKRAGPVFAFVGSRSAVTAAQVERAALYEKLVVTPADMVGNRAGLAALVNSCKASLAERRHVLVSISAQRESGLSGSRLASATADFIKDVVTAVRPGCLAIAGGDTSSAAIQHLAIDSISTIADFDRGVPLVRAHSRDDLDALPMILKGGQVGSVDLFDKLARFFTA